MKEKQKRSAFSGKIGFVLSAAGASVGLGNIWRFPYLAAKYGGGIFLLVYIILALTFGYTMIVAETAIGRMTGKSPVGAFASFGSGKGLKFGGWINAVIPILIVPYYSVIGGWVIKYLLGYLLGQGHLLAADGYFGSFISSGLSVELCFIGFISMTLAIIFAGVENGIERVSKVMMPILVVLSVIIAAYSVTRPGALEGVKYFLVPNLQNFSWMTVVSAMGQMFYSLSIAMGILITFGSYMKKSVSIEESTQNVEIFDTAIAIMAGLMIIPAVFAFSGGPESRSLTDVHHHPQGLRLHGPGHRHRDPLLPAGALCRPDQLHRPDGKRRVHPPGRAGLEPEKGHQHDGPFYAGPRHPVLPGLRPAGQRDHPGNAVSGLLRFPHQFRDDAHCRHRHLHCGIQSHRRGAH